jgi:hypothetical protein
LRRAVHTRRTRSLDGGLGGFSAGCFSPLSEPAVHDPLGYLDHPPPL